MAKILQFPRKSAEDYLPMQSMCECGCIFAVHLHLRHCPVILNGIVIDFSSTRTFRLSVLQPKLELPIL